MSKKNVVLLLLIASIATILIMTFFGMKAKLSEYTYINSICLYDENNLSICDENETVTTVINLGDYKENTLYYFQLKLDCDREIDPMNLDFVLTQELVGVNIDTASLEEITKEEYAEAREKEVDSFLEKEVIYDENGDPVNYIYASYFKLTIKKESSVEINIVAKRNNKLVKQRSVRFSFSAQGQGGSSDIDF